MAKSLEEWRAIPGHSGYEISTLGRVRNAATKRLRRAYINAAGSPFLKLGETSIRVKRLMQLAFFPDLPHGQNLYPKDFNKTNLRLDNLMAMTQAEWETLRTPTRKSAKRKTLDQEAAEIVQFYIDGVSLRTLAREFDVSISTISKMVKRETA